MGSGPGWPMQRCRRRWVGVLRGRVGGAGGGWPGARTPDARAAAGGYWSLEGLVQRGVGGGGTTGNRRWGCDSGVVAGSWRWGILPGAGGMGWGWGSGEGAELGCRRGGMGRRRQLPGCSPRRWSSLPAAWRQPLARPGAAGRRQGPALEWSLWEWRYGAFARCSALVLGRWGWGGGSGDGPVQDDRGGGWVWVVVRAATVALSLGRGAGGYSRGAGAKGGSRRPGAGSRPRQSGGSWEGAALGSRRVVAGVGWVGVSSYRAGPGWRWTSLPAAWRQSLARPGAAGSRQRPALEWSWSAWRHGAFARCLALVLR